MARYFFHLCDGEDILLDPDGRKIDEGTSFHELALKEARAIIAHDAKAGRIRLGLSIEVRNEDDQLVHRLSFRDAIQIGD